MATPRTQILIAIDRLSLPEPSSSLQVKACPPHPPEGTAWQGRGPGPRTQPLGQGRKSHGASKAGEGGPQALPESSHVSDAQAFLPG